MLVEIEILLGIPETICWVDSVIERLITAMQKYQRMPGYQARSFNIFDNSSVKEFKSARLYKR